MTKKKGVALLQARIEKELREIKEVVDRTEKSFWEISQEAPADIIINGFAGYVHGFYNGLEKIFNLIAEYVDHFEPRDKAWPQEILKQMTLEIQGVRPAVLTKELAHVLKDYLEFRHFFRHSYSFDLDWEELKPKVKNLKATFDQLEAALQRFFIFLQAAGEHIE